MNKALENACTEALGVSKIDNRTATQATYTCYHMQQSLGENFHAVWALANPFSDKVTRMNIPVTTRWWGLITAVIHLTTNWDEWQRLAKLVVDTYDSKLMISKVASDCYSFLNEPQIKADLLFIGAFGKDLFMPMFKWLQGVDFHAKVFGHRARSMAEFTFPLNHSLQAITEDGSSRPQFRDYVNHWATLDAETIKQQRSKEGVFFRYFQATVTKHFARWTSSPNIIMAFGGEPLLASALAK